MRSNSSHERRGHAQCDASGDAWVERDVDLDEAALIRSAGAGSESAFRELVDRHYDACLRYATRMLGNRADAEDAVQETFARAYRSLRGYRESGRFRGWLFRILMNRCRTTARARSRWKLVTFGPERTNENRLEVRQPEPQVRLQLVQSAVSSLPEALREAFLLKHVEEWTYEEMAELTGASVSALKMRVLRAREALRAQLEEAADESG